MTKGTDYAIEESRANKATLIAGLRADLNETTELRERARSNPADWSDRRHLRAWQSARLARSYADLLASPRYRPAVAFFRDDLYGVQSTEQRDWDLGGLLPTLARVLPTAAIAALAHAMALNCLSERLDAELIGALRSTGSLAGITPERYGAAYRSCGRRAEREKQIVLVIDVGRTAIGIIRAIPQLFKLYPDVIFSTGGFAAFPTLVAARVLSIPVVIYDADAHPGRVSLWSSRFAKAIAVAHPEAAAQFPARVRHRIARVGHPIRKEILGVAKEGGFEFLNLDTSVPAIFFMGGSQGARAINETVLDALPDLAKRYNIIHQTGWGYNNFFLIMAQNCSRIARPATVTGP